MSETSITIDRRFCGPPRSGNGGYVAGRLASFVDAPAVGVRLSLPPPLETPLSVLVSGGEATLFDEARQVARARAVDLDLTPPAAPGFEAAVEAARGFRGFEEHVFPGCFVCGPDRDGSDGLRIFPGPSGEASLFAAPWIPDVSLVPGGAQGDPLPPEFVWAALDCPGAFSFPQPDGKVVLLGEMQVALSGPVHVGERCVLTSWEVEHVGRKHLTGSALFGQSGACRGVSLGLWFEVDPESVPRDSI